MVADSGNGRIQLFDAASLAYAATLGGSGKAPGDPDFLGRPVTAAYDPITNLSLIADQGSDNRVRVFDAMTYGPVLTLGDPGATGTGVTQFAAPAGLAADTAHSQLFIGDSANERVQIFSIARPITVASILPGSRSVAIGAPATIFATMINSGATTLSNCQAALPATAPAGLTLHYQTTDPSTNALSGTPDTPATIAGKNGAQTFLITLLGSAPVEAPGLAIDFGCADAAPAAVAKGVDTVDFSASTSATADIIALSATAANDGIVAMPVGGIAAFAVATDNVGAAAGIIASADTGSATLPVAVTLCQSDPATGQCLSTPAATVPVSFAAGATPTFSVFVQSSGPVAFAPASARVFLRFKDAAGGIHGSTSVAVETK